MRSVASSIPMSLHWWQRGYYPQGKLNFFLEFFLLIYPDLSQWTNWDHFQKLLSALISICSLGNLRNSLKELFNLSGKYLIKKTLGFFWEAVDHFEPLPEYTPRALGQSLTLQAPTPALGSQVIGQRLYQVHEEMWHMQRCRELFTAAMRGVADLVYNLEADRLLLRGEEVNVELSSSDEDSVESEGDAE